jgi:hypothetical protein
MDQTRDDRLEDGCANLHRKTKVVFRKTGENNREEKTISANRVASIQSEHISSANCCIRTVGQLLPGKKRHAVFETTTPIRKCMPHGLTGELVVLLKSVNSLIKNVVDREVYHDLSQGLHMWNSRKKTHKVQ